MENPRKYGRYSYTVAVIHGGPGASGEMKAVAERLSSSWGVIEPLQTKLSLQGQIDELKRQLTNSGNPPITLISFSWGAWLSLLTAADYPSLIKKVIIIGSGPFEENYADRTLQIRLQRLSPEDQAEFRAALNTLQALSHQENHAFQKVENITRKTDQYDPISDADEDIMFRRQVYQEVWREADILRKSGKLLDRIKEVKCPVTAIHGEYDPHPAEGVKKPLSRVIEDFQFIPLEKCGHKPWIEKKAKANFFNILEKQI
ncbi:MAG: alpha/beta hydrolase [Promethearchaeia archaeon]